LEILGASRYIRSMRNLYTYTLSRDEIRGLMEHYKLVGVEWAQVFEKEMLGKNDEALVYPKYPAPVVVGRDGKCVLDHMGWGMPSPVPPIRPGEKPKRPAFLTNVRNTRSGHWRNWLASANVTVGKEKLQGGRSIVPATMFAEPDRNTRKPVVNRWFGRSDGVPFFFAGIWREWQGDHGTIKAPNVGLHRLFAILTTEPNGTVQPIHDKAMPVMLMTAADVDVWPNGTLDEALKLQRLQPDDALVITPYDEKKAA
jgi:putative SOS response-associated peptidase YedK